MKTERTAWIGLGNGGDSDEVEGVDDKGIQTVSSTTEPDILVYFVFLPDTDSNSAVTDLKHKQTVMYLAFGECLPDGVSWH